MKPLLSGQVVWFNLSQQLSMTELLNHTAPAGWERNLEQ